MQLILHRVTEITTTTDESGQNTIFRTIIVDTEYGEFEIVLFADNFNSLDIEELLS